MTNSTVTLSAGQLRKAAAVREKIDKLERQLAVLLGSPAATPRPAPKEPSVAPRKRRRMSTAARAKMAAAAKARWAKAKKAGRNRL
jgi:hypothetical protein